MARWCVNAAMIVWLTSSPVFARLCGPPTATDGYEQLDQGYRALYDLDFDRAQTTFMQWEVHAPQNALGPASRASGYLFQEFERLGVLRSELFTDDKSFEGRSKPLPDQQLKLRFQQQISAADRLADEMLATNPSSSDALLAKTW